jgi:alkanesulfonate monooxygenase SsuD/methylene tetrahydromethanopterin reductase-like flavin-dependent oxidoreductase (luciferase family)
MPKAFMTAKSRRRRRRDDGELGEHREPEDREDGRQHGRGGVDAGVVGDGIRAPTVPVPPLWVGGTSLPALRRAVRFGNGWLSGLQTPGEFAASRQRLFDLFDEAGRPRPLSGIGLHAAIGTGSDRDLAEVTAGTMHSMYGLVAAAFLARLASRRHAKAPYHRIIVSLGH